MVQKTTWMRYLTLGISITCIFTSLQCKKTVDYNVKGTFTYINNTDSLLEVKRGLYNFAVKPNQTHTIETSGDGPKVVTEKNYAPPFQGGEIIIYGITKCDTLLIPKEGISGIVNYTNEKIGTRHYKFTYTFTELDYNKAVICK